ncbi:hypothetical protein F2Q68_00045464 [Brassica cretica]|uniref:Uncharacterized protein n=1 Tax=Brassica cretica TaxID=69181 RepID=A0A8S9LH79_BRACR|nr:hypothetical protein F2Q68_00045464 [Brassica cretica]
MRGEPENTLRRRRRAVVGGGGGRFSRCCRNQERKGERGREFVGVEGISAAAATTSSATSALFLAIGVFSIFAIVSVTALSFLLLVAVFFITVLLRPNDIFGSNLKLVLTTETGYRATVTPVKSPAPTT